MTMLNSDSRGTRKARISTRCVGGKGPQGESDVLAAANGDGDGEARECVGASDVEEDQGL